MTYQVLARKWRPRDFGSLVGQEHVVRALRHALESNRLHHAYLFTGTRGVGKTTLARILAKCLNCETGVGPQPCGTCSACVEIDSGRFVDLLEVDAATNTKVDEMRQLLETAQYSPTRGRFKVYVIDEVHMLSNSAFNAMLKTLEEPPAHLKFILATTDPQKIPVTVLSRCLQFNLKQMPPGAIVAHLVGVLEKEGVSFERDALAMLARAAGGSMRDSLSLLDQAIAHGEGAVTTGMVTDMLGTIDQGYLLRILEAVAAGDAGAAVGVVDEMQGRSISFDSALSDLSSLLLRLALVQAVPDALESDVPQRDAIVELAAKLDPELVQLYYQMTIHGRQDLPLAPDEHGGFLMTVLRMLSFREEGGAERSAPRPAQRSTTGARPVQPPPRPVRQAVPASEAGAALSPVAAASGAEEWAKLCQEIQVTGAARELARNAELRGRTGDVFELVVPKAKAYLAERTYVEKLKAALQGRLGEGASVRVAVGDTAGASPADVEAGERQIRQAEVRQSVRTDGFVNDLINLFDGKVVDSTIRENEK